ncbi:hypothetical protein [Ekhidna sp. To15]|uniref:hypothetical protein n=1 Tax=Ekhidna sp. To15 TaxID=3395267 RepID=UPI003F5223EB
MKPFIQIFFTSIYILTITGCSDGIGAQYKVQRVIKNSSNVDIEITLFFEQNEIDSLILPKDSIMFSAYCVSVGSELQCSNPSYSYSHALGLEDSVYLIFNDNERIIRFERESIDPCCSKNILKQESQWGYEVLGIGTSIETYTYEITNEDYEMAEPYDGGD